MRNHLGGVLLALGFLAGAACTRSSASCTDEECAGRGLACVDGYCRAVVAASDAATDAARPDAPYDSPLYDADVPSDTADAPSDAADAPTDTPDAPLDGADAPDACVRGTFMCD